jgi:hypothetical protein
LDFRVGASAEDLREKAERYFEREINVFEREKPKQNQKYNQLLTIFHSYAHKKRKFTSLFFYTF